MENKDYIYKNERKAPTGNIVKNAIAATLMGLVIVSLAVYGIFFSVKSRKQEIMLQNYAQHSFINMMDYVHSVEDCLFMAMVCSSPVQAIDYLSEARQYTMLAEEDLCNLPIDESSQEQISHYLVTLNDISGTISRQLADGVALSDDENKMLEVMYGYCQDLSGALGCIHEDLLTGSSSWKDITKKSKNITHDRLLAEQNVNLKRLAEPFSDMPAFEYNGKYSSHICNIEPKGLNGEEISKEDGEKIVRQLLYNSGEEYTDVQCMGEHLAENINVFCYTVTHKEDKNYYATIDITKQGGMLCNMAIYGKNGDAVIGLSEAEEIGRTFLAENGYKDMEVVFSEEQGNEADINYVYVKNDIFYYPDMCKVRISLSDGKIIGFDAHNYLCCHEGRFLKTPDFTIEEGMEKLNDKIEVVSSRHAVIFTGYKTEKQVYEYKCMALGREFYVCVDVDSKEVTDGRLEI